MKGKSPLLIKKKNMKKKSRVINTGSKIARVFSRIFNIRAWFDWDRVKSFTLYLYNGFKRFFIPQQASTSESFDEAVAKLHLTEKDILLKQKALFRLSIVMVMVAVVILFYSIYQLLYGSYAATLLSLVIMFIALVLAFRYNFWYFQIKHRKLGCSFKEWYRQGLLGEKE